MNRSDGSNRHAAGGSDPAARLYVITLASAVAPMPLRGPSAPQLAGLAVFRSRHIEDGRERFRLHLGFFASEADAECLLPVVREDYPAAIAAIAPEGSMNSLEDTAAARFSILRPAARAAASTRSGLSRPVVAPQALRAVAPPQLRVIASPPAASPVAQPARPAAAPAPRQAPARANPAMARMTSTAANAPTRSPLEAPRAPTFNGIAATQAPAPVPTPAPAPAAAAAADAAVGADGAANAGQHYAVQLIWNQAPIDLDSIPILAIFTGYVLYAVESEPGQRRCYGVRLGFYADAMSARLVAQYVRSEFKGVSVVPVSPREMSRASSAAIRLGASRRAQSLSGGRTRWPASALSVDPQSLRRAFTPGAG